MQFWKPRKKIELNKSKLTSLPLRCDGHKRGHLHGHCFFDFEGLGNTGETMLVVYVVLLFAARGQIVGQGHYSHDGPGAWPLEKYPANRKIGKLQNLLQLF